MIYLDRMLHEPYKFNGSYQSNDDEISVELTDVFYTPLCIGAPQDFL